MITAIIIVLGIIVMCFLNLALKRKSTNKKKTAQFFGKLPKPPEDASKDSCDAAKKTLQDMYRRR